MFKFEFIQFLIFLHHSKNLNIVGKVKESYAQKIVRSQ